MSHFSKRVFLLLRKNIVLDYTIKQIEVGDVLCEIETDKATLEFESLEEG